MTERHGLNKERCEQKPISDVCDALHFPTKVSSSELAQASRSVSTELSITARPLCSMRNEPSRVTWPSSRAARLYCLAVWRTAASFDGVTETMARAPRSLKAANSAVEDSFSKFAIAPSTGAACCAPTKEDPEAKQDSARVTARPPSEMSWADWRTPSAARATRQSWRRFSAASAMAGGSPATMPAIVLEYSEEENSRAGSEVASGEWRVAIAGDSAL